MLGNQAGITCARAGLVAFTSGAAYEACSAHMPAVCDAALKLWLDSVKEAK